MRNIARLTIAAIMSMTGCAAIRGMQARDTEELLEAAGFNRQPLNAAHTKLEQATPPYLMVSRTKDGAMQYTYSDPDHCRCVYVGNSREYAEYQRLAKERRIARERLLYYEDVWDRNNWGPW